MELVEIEVALNKLSAALVLLLLGSRKICVDFQLCPLRCNLARLKKYPLELWYAALANGLAYNQ